MLASFRNLAVARPPQFIAPAHGPQCPNVSNATGRFNLTGIKRSANDVNTKACQKSDTCWQNSGLRRIISSAKWGYLSNSNARRSNWCNVFIGSTSIVNIYHIKTVSSIHNSDQLLPLSKLEFLSGRRRFSSSLHEVRKRSHRNLKRPLFNSSPNPTETSLSIANKTQICLDFKFESTISTCGHQSLLLATKDVHGFCVHNVSSATA